MANICDNELHLQTEYSENKEAIKEYFSDWTDSNISYEEDENIEIYFPSKWEFPEKEMTELINSLPHPFDVTGACLSYEWGCYYTEFHVLENGKWFKQE